MIEQARVLQAIARRAEAMLRLSDPDEPGAAARLGVATEADPGGAVRFLLVLEGRPALPLLTLRRLQAELSAGDLRGSSVADAVFTAAMQRRGVWSAAAADEPAGGLVVHASLEAEDAVAQAAERARKDLFHRLGFQPEPIVVKAAAQPAPRRLLVLNGERVIAAAETPLPSEAASRVDPAVLRVRARRNAGDGVLSIVGIAIDPRRAAFRALIRTDDAATDGALGPEEFVADLLRHVLLSERARLLTPRIERALILGAWDAAPRHIAALVEALGPDVLSGVLRILVSQGVSLQPLMPAFTAILDAHQARPDLRDVAALAETARAGLGPSILRGIGAPAREVGGIEVRVLDGSSSPEASREALGAALGASPHEPPRLLTASEHRVALERLARGLDPTAQVIGLDEIPPRARIMRDRIIEVDASALSPATQGDEGG